MRHVKIKQFVLLIGLLFSTAWSSASITKFTDGHSHIQIKEAMVQSIPKGSSIQAFIDGHYLSVSFTENLGQVAIEITTDTGSTVSTIAMTTPNGYVFYIALAGDYIVTFTLPNGDEYYGEFTVTD